MLRDGFSRISVLWHGIKIKYFRNKISFVDKKKKNIIISNALNLGIISISYPFRFSFVLALA